MIYINKKNYFLTISNRYINNPYQLTKLISEYDN